MSIYLQQLVLAAAVVYIVDVSGFTESWRNAIARWLHVSELRDLPPFDCGKCMTFWSTLALAAINGQLHLLTFAAAAALALLSKSFSAVMIFISENIEAFFDSITPNR